MKLNQAGNTLVIVLVASTLILGAVVISMQYVGLTNRTSITALKNNLASSDELTSLNIFAGKLYLTKNGAEWGVEPYPTAAELGSINFTPYIKNFSTATSSLVPNIRIGGKKDLSAPGGCRTLPVPRDIKDINYVVQSSEDCEITNFDLDGSRLGSLERGGDILGWNADLSRRLQTEFQKGFVGYPKLSQLKAIEVDNFFRTQNGLFPENGIDAKAVTFYKIASDPAEPRILSQLEVGVGNTRAIIPINAPPEPTCKLTTTISPRFMDCHQESTVTYTHGIVGYHNETTQTSQTRTVPTSTPRTSLAVSRCSNNPGASYPPLYPSINNCVGYAHNYGTITFYSTTRPIYHINLGARPGFPQRGMIYATDPGGEILGQDEINGMYKISFEQLLSELGVSSVIIENKEETVVTQSTIRVPDYGNIPVYGTKTVCNPRETPECNGDCIELSSGRGVTANLYADSLLGMAQVTGDSFRTFVNFPVDTRQSIKTIREFPPEFPNETPTREIWGSKLVLPPANLYLVQGARLWTNEDGSIDDEHGVWTVSGKVAGLKRASSSTTCDTNLKVFPPPPPACIVSVANPNILQGETTEVTLNCQGPSSGRVTSAQILNGAAFDVSSFAPSQRRASNYKIAKALYGRRGSYLSETINIIVRGLGAPNGIVVTALLGQVCHHNDPNSLSYISREGFRQAPLRRTPYWDGRWITYATTWGHGGWNAGYADCSIDSFCMTSIEASTRNRRGSWFPYPGLYASNGGYYVAQIGPKRSPHCYITRYSLRKSGCFTPDTRIKMADGQEKLVSKISENDLIWNPLYQSPVKVIKVVKGPEKKALYQLRVAKNRLVVTEDHPFLTQRGWMRADQLNTKDLIMGEGLGKQILSIKKLSYKKPIDVYNFELETDIREGHMVIANGIPTGDLTTQIAIKQNEKKIH